MKLTEEFLKVDPFLKIVLVIVALLFLLYWAGYIVGKLIYYISH